MPADGWDPAQYARFGEERQQPFFDLLALLHPAPGCRAVDLGCGTGELTVALHKHLLAGETVGIDRSAAMLDDSERWAVEGVWFGQRDIASFPDPDGSDGHFDVIAANASLQWVHDHDRLLAALTTALQPHGQLAFQVPTNNDHPSHSVAEEVAAEPAFAGVLAGGGDPRLAPVLAPEEYAEALHRLGYTEQVVRLQVYGHLLGSTDDVVEWVKGTLLTPYRERLDPATYEAYIERYRTRLLEVLGDQRPYFYPFKRILCWARLP
ncbi:MAG: trans-aconitate 2-methyltransferase [Acidimicrobiaceae bacterium]|jgi:trans-aconitate 2-methyltransferase|nr:trans-aconitate 2-methyltransferase [Acidimicrobiaceae bacterium]MDQ1369052.1 trans-aconitate 2-methyltransferase [Acidimicrobiaceae bacterium]